MIRFALSQEQLDIVERLVASGRFEAPQTVIGAALALLETRERERIDCLAALHQALSDDRPDDAGRDAADVTPASDAPSLSSEPFDADALDEIERLIASKAAVAKPADALV